MECTIAETLKEVIIELCQEHHYELIALEVMVDHVHVFLSAPPKVTPSIIAKVLKGSTARMLFTMQPVLKMVLRNGHLWNPGHDVGSAGQVSSEIIQ